MKESSLKNTDYKEDFPYWLAFGFVSHLGPVRFKLLLEYFGSARAIWQAPKSKLVETGLNLSIVDDLFSLRQWFFPQKIKRRETNLGSIIASPALAQAGNRLGWAKEVKDYQKAAREPILVLTWMDKLYPQRLRLIDGSPPVIYVKSGLVANMAVGNDSCHCFQALADIFEQKALAVVGTRKATAYGQQVTQELVTDLVGAGVVIVSGMALGVDGIAHRAAIRSRGKTVAVLGSGIDVVYPYNNKDIYQRLVNSTDGLVVSEFPPGYPVKRENFPIRNRIITGLSDAVLVTQAAQKSGTMITSRLAAEQGKDVFAVPGEITSQLSAGTSWLIKQGAKLVSSADDILTEM